MKRRFVRFFHTLAVLLISGILPAAAAPQVPEFISRLSGGRVAGSGFKDTVDFNYVDGRICIKARLNGESIERRFILDTYAVCLPREGILSIPGLDILDMSQELGARFEKTPMKPVFPKFAKVTIGRVVFEDIGAMTLRESSGNALASRLEDGLIGANLMRHCIWQIDFERRKITLTDRIESLGGLENAARVSFVPKPMQYSPDIEVSLDNGEKAILQFDTGSTGFLSLLTPSLKTMVEGGKAVSWTARLDRFIEAPGESGPETNYFFRLRSVTVGSRSFENLPVAVFNSSRPELIGRGSLGMEFLKNFVVTLDWKSNTVYLAPIPGKEVKRNIRTFGFTYGHRDGAVRVESLYGGSPAEKAGLRIGDAIISINGKPVDRLNADEIGRFRDGDLRFSNESDAEIALEIVRDGKTVSFRFAAYEIFPEK